MLFNLANLRVRLYARAMPTLTKLNSDQWTDPDTVDRAVVTYWAQLVEIGDVERESHSHKKGQIILVQRGALSCEVAGGLWIVPPRSAIWIPGGALHAIKGSRIEGYNAFISPDAACGLPTTCCVLSVTPLLRELMIRSARLPLFYDEASASSRMVTVMLDEIAASQVENLHLPMPADGRLRDLVEQMLKSPSVRGTMEFWAERACVSERTLARLVQRETGMSFGRWRQQLTVMLAVKWMAEGASIHAVASDLGYDSGPSFITMFKKTLGAPPARYMAERHADC
jgi:AraC-like DNA-binding protein